MRRLSRSQLLPVLRKVYRTPKGSPIEVAASVFTLILWESGGQVGLAGDKGASMGLLQIHQPTWAGRLGTFDPAQVADEVPLGKAVAYELAYARQRVEVMRLAILRAIATVAARSRRGVRGFIFNPVRDVPVWASIAWQYGEDDLLRWVKEATDLSPRGFRSWRLDVGKRVHPDFDKRSKFMVRTYLLSLENPPALLAAIRDVSMRTGVDFFTTAASTLRIARAKLEEWKKATTGRLVRSIKAKGNLVGTGLLAAGAIFAATERGPDGELRIRKDVKDELGAAIAGIGMTLVAGLGD